MGRLIDADAMLEYLNLMYDEQHSWRDDYNVGVLGAINYIKHKAPTIDAVSVVRCKDCVFGELDNRAEMYRCRLVSFPHWNKGEHFCSYGERKTDHEQRSH